MENPVKSLFLVAAQFISIYYMFHLTPWSSYNIFSLSLLIIGSMIGLWSIYSMRKSKLRITPDVAKGAKLIEEGPYKYIRHPMYTGVLTAMLGVLIAGFSSQKLLAYILLKIVLFIKISYEESLLGKNLKGYDSYCKKTYRLIPLIY